MVEIPWSERSLLDNLLTHHQPLDDDADDTVTDADVEDKLCEKEERGGEEEEEGVGDRPLRHLFPRHIG